MAARCLEMREEFSYRTKYQDLKEIINNIESAKYGVDTYYKCHPDFIRRLDPIVLGDFPNNIDKIYWFHNGYDGSLNPNSSPVSPCYELCVIMKLKTSCYMSFHYKQVDLSLNAFASSHYDKIIENLSDNVYWKYLEETQLMQKTPVFCPSSLSPIKTAKHAYTPLSNTPVVEDNSGNHMRITLDKENTTFWDSMKDMSPIELNKIPKKTTFQETDSDEKIDLQQINEDEYNGSNEEDDDSSSTQTSYSEELRRKNWDSADW